MQPFSSLFDDPSKSSLLLVSFSISASPDLVIFYVYHFSDSLLNSFVLLCSWSSPVTSSPSNLLFLLLLSSVLFVHPTFGLAHFVWKMSNQIAIVGVPASKGQGCHGDGLQHLLKRAETSFILIERPCWCHCDVTCDVIESRMSHSVCHILGGLKVDVARIYMRQVRCGKYTDSGILAGKQLQGWPTWKWSWIAR